MIFEARDVNPPRNVRAHARFNGKFKSGSRNLRALSNKPTHLLNFLDVLWLQTACALLVFHAIVFWVGQSSKMFEHDCQLLLYESTEVHLIVQTAVHALVLILLITEQTDQAIVHLLGPEVPGFGNAQQRRQEPEHCSKRCTFYCLRAPNEVVVA